MRVSIKYANWGLEKGGIQSWLFLIKKNIRHFYGDCNCTITTKEAGLLKLILSAFVVSDFTVVGTWKYLPFCTLSLVARKKVFVLAHGNELLNMSFLSKSFIRFVGNFKNVIWICNSNYTRNLVLEISDVNRALVKHPFVNINDSLIKAKTRLESVRLLTISRLVKRKNIESVLIALHELKTEGFKFSYEIGGGGEQYEYYMKMIESLGLTHEVSLLGRVSEEKKKMMYTQADVFVLPSLFDRENGSVEGFGMVYIEAYSYGIPVISGCSGGMSEAVVDGVTGIVTDGKTKSLKRAIIKTANTTYDCNRIIKESKKYHWSAYDFIKDILLCNSD